MELSQNLELEIKLEATNEFNNPTADFGERVRVLIFNETQQSLPQNIVDDFNAWQEFIIDPQFTWRHFVKWLWKIIKEWWDSLWE